MKKAGSKCWIRHFGGHLGIGQGLQGEATNDGHPLNRPNASAVRWGFILHLFYDGIMR